MKGVISLRKKLPFRAVLILGAGALLLAKSGTVADGIRAGIHVCLEQAVPALFPFLIFAEFFAVSGVGKILAAPFPMLERLLGYPRGGASVLLLSLAGGYPAGPKMLAELTRSGRLSAAAASSMLCSCVNVSPAFLIAGVSVPFFGSVKPGAIMFCCQMAASLAAALLTRLFWGSFWKEPSLSKNYTPPPTVDSFVHAASSGGKSMLLICCYVLLFSAFSALLAPLPHSQSWIGFLEVTLGCAGLGAFPFWEKVVLATAFTSFGGICVWMQTAALLRDSGISMKKFALMRCVHLFVSLFLTIFCFKRMPVPAEVFSSYSTASVLRGSATAASAALLILVCMMGLLYGGKCDKI